ncbi:MAG: hypothetical protein H6818_08735 [Phycisphaerales bacterium]|nr:hypothetical protein [Phycisphaerales bacterium]MCB9862656.1 hypothetical protein [Phycisphaerales bacterium]
MTLAYVTAVNVMFVLAGALAEPPSVAAPDDVDRVPEIFVEVRYVQVDTTKLKVLIEGYPPSGGQEKLPVMETDAIRLEPRNAMRDVSTDRSTQREFGRPGAATEGGAFEGVVLPGLVDFRLEGKSVSPDRIPTGSSPRDEADVPDGLEFLKAIASPRLLLFSGQGASFTSGMERAYLEKESADCLRLKWTGGEGDDQMSMAEGSAFEVNVALQEDGAIRFDPMKFQYRYMIGREPIDGVPLDVGKPIIKTMKMSISLVMKQNATAVFAFPRDSEDTPLILALVRAYERVQAPKMNGGESTHADVKP